MNTRHSHSAVFALCAAAVLALPAFAATPIDQTRPLAPDGRIEIENLKGSIEVRGWDRPQVSIEGSLGEGVEKLEIEGDRQRLSVRVRYPGSGGLGLFGSGESSEPSHLRLMVPLRASLEVDSVSAEVDVVGVAPRELSIDSVSGEVTVAGAPGEAEISTVSGDQRLTLNSSDVDVESVSGDVLLSGRLDGRIDAETVSGRIDVEVLDSRVKQLSGATVSGDIRVDTALASNGEIGLESVSGDLELNLPRDLSATVHGNSFSGDLQASDARIEHAEHGPGSSFRHRYGSGDGEVSLETFSGNAQLSLD